MVEEDYACDVLDHLRLILVTRHLEGRHAASGDLDLVQTKLHADAIVLHGFLQQGKSLIVRIAALHQLIVLGDQFVVLHLKNLHIS